MSWFGGGDLIQLETPECLRQFIKELVDTELISEREKVRIYSQQDQNATQTDPLLEMDFRHNQAKEINAANLARMKIPKQELLKEARRIVSEEEVVEKLARQQNAAFNRELRQLKEDLERSSRAMKRPGRTSSACKKLPEVENVRVEKQRAKSCSSEIEARLSTLSLDFHDQIQLEGERNESSTYSSDWHSEDEEPSDASSPSSASTILENKHVEEEEEEKLSLPPLMNVSKSAKDDLEIKSLRRCWLVWRAVTFRQKNMRRLKRDDDEKQSQIEQFVNRQTFVSKKTKSCSNLEQIIRDQKAKLREQERLISRLKLEQLRLEAEKSQQNAQTLMAHSLQDSSLPVRRKLKYLRSSFPDILDGGRVDNKSRPSFLVLMEQRQAERLRRKKELHERTQLRVEQQKRLQKEREEARRAELAEQRRLEQEARVEKMRLEAERRANEQAARAFCRLRRLRMAFRLFRAILLQRRRRIMEAEERRRLRLMGEAFRRWRQVVREKSQERMVQAKRHHRRKVMTFAWDKWTQAVMERKRDWQVAEDFSDLLFAVKLFKFGSHACLLEKRAEQIRREKYCALISNRMTSEESSALSEVFTKLPGRRKQCRILLDFFTTDGYLPPNIYIHGNSATGKTITVASLLEHLGISNVQLSCVEFDTPALLSSQVATKFREYVEGSNQSNCSNLMDLVEVMQTADFKDPFIIVLDRAERLREMPSTVIPALLKLQELSGMNVCVVLVSDLPWERFYHGKMRFCKPAFDLFFPQYSKSECIEIIREKRPEEVDDALYFSYVSILLRVLYRFCRDLNELLYMADQHFVLVKDLNNDQRTIWTTLQPHLKAATQRVHLRQGLQPVDVKSSNALISAVTAMELPYYAKFLLMAAFLASFNSPKHDRRLFAKHHGMQRKKAVVQKKTVKRSSLIVGPKPFNFERLTAIFHSIADTPYLITTNLCAQLATLVNLQLITKVGFSGLNDPKYKCAVGFEFIKAVGRTVDFNVQSYIMEEY